MAGGALGLAKYALGNIWDEIGAGVGTAAKAYGKRAAQWGGVGAAVGGTSEWAQGGSFWEGAKSGAFTGAMYGATARAVRVGSGAKAWGKTFGGYGEAWGQLDGAFKTGATGGGEVSGQLSTILRASANERLARGVTSSFNSGKSFAGTMSSFGLK